MQTLKFGRVQIQVPNGKAKNIPFFGRQLAKLALLHQKHAVLYRQFAFAQGAERDVVFAKLLANLDQTAAIYETLPLALKQAYIQQTRGVQQ